MTLGAELGQHFVQTHIQKIPKFNRGLWTP